MRKVIVLILTYLMVLTSPLQAGIFRRGGCCYYRPTYKTYKTYPVIKDTVKQTINNITYNKNWKSQAFEALDKLEDHRAFQNTMAEFLKEYGPVSSSQRLQQQVQNYPAQPQGVTQFSASNYGQQNTSNFEDVLDVLVRSNLDEQASNRGMELSASLMDRSIAGKLELHKLSAKTVDFAVRMKAIEEMMRYADAPTGTHIQQQSSQPVGSHMQGSAPTPPTQPTTPNNNQQTNNNPRGIQLQVMRVANTYCAKCHTAGSGHEAIKPTDLFPEGFTTDMLIGGATNNQLKRISQRVFNGEMPPPEGNEAMPIEDLQWFSPVMLGVK